MQSTTTRSERACMQSKHAPRHGCGMACRSMLVKEWHTGECLSRLTSAGRAASKKGQRRTQGERAASKEDEDTRREGGGTDLGGSSRDALRLYLVVIASLIIRCSQEHFHAPQQLFLLHPRAQQAREDAAVMHAGAATHARRVRAAGSGRQRQAASDDAQHLHLTPEADALAQRQRDRERDKDRDRKRDRDRDRQGVQIGEIEPLPSSCSC
jgi:hypothetical protein